MRWAMSSGFSCRPPDRRQGGTRGAIITSDLNTGWLFNLCFTCWHLSILISLTWFCFWRHIGFCWCLWGYACTLPSSHSFKTFNLLPYKTFHLKSCTTVPTPGRHGKGFFRRWNTLASASFFYCPLSSIHIFFFCCGHIVNHFSPPLLGLSSVYSPLKSSPPTASSSVSICTQAATELQLWPFLPPLLALLNIIPLLYFPICCLSSLCFCAGAHVDNNAGMQVLAGWFTWYTEPLTRLRLAQMLSDTASSRARSSFPWAEFILARAPTGAPQSDPPTGWKNITSDERDHCFVLFFLSQQSSTYIEPSWDVYVVVVMEQRSPRCKCV